MHKNDYDEIYKDLIYVIDKLDMAKKLLTIQHDNPNIKTSVDIINDSIVYIDSSLNDLEYISEQVQDLLKNLEIFFLKKASSF